MTAYQLSEHCTVLVDQRQLVINGQRARVGSRAFDILLELIGRHGEVVTKNDLLAAVWPGFVVDDNNLAVHIGALRRLLGAGAIATVSGRGYRLEVVPMRVNPTATNLLPAPSQPAAAPALPVLAPSSMVGRRHDLDTLQSLVRRQVLTSLVGAAGIGKSTLARRVLESQREHFANGAIWCDLDSLVDADMVCSRLAQALSVERNAGDPLAALSDLLRPMSMLVVLDGAERVIGETARVVTLLMQAAPGLRFLVTTQVPLQLEMEHVLRLQPLSIPASTATVANAMEHGSVQLFVSRASQGTGNFRLSESNVADVITICRRLDGIPLAIELAAARAATLGTSTLARMLDHRFRLLRSFNRSTSVRHATLKSALDWSHGLLSQEERIVFRRSGVFHRGFAMQSLLAVADDGALGADRVVEALQSLIDKSLVQVEPGSPSRYRLLESTRSLANDHLVEAGEADSIRHRHATDVVSRFRDAFRDANQARHSIDDIRSSLVPDLDNAHVAMVWALSHAPQMACVLMPALSFASAEARFRDLQTLWDATRQHVSEDLPMAVRADWALGYAMFWSNRDIQRMDQWATEAVELYQSLSDHDGLYCAHAVLVVVAARRGLPLADQLARLQASAHPSLSMTTLRYGATSAAIAASVGGNPELAVKHLQESLALARATGDSLNVASAEVNLLDAELAQGRVDEAIAYGVSAMEQLRRKRHHGLMGMVQLNLAAAYAAKGKVLEVAELAREGWSTAIADGLQAYWADYLALTCALQGRHVDAAQLLGYGDMKYEQYHTHRVGNELAAATQAQQMAEGALDASALQAARRQGTRLSDADIPQLITALQEP